MHCYTVTVATGNALFSGTDAYIYFTLVGTERCSEKTVLNKFFHHDFKRGAVDKFDIEVAEDLGEIVLVKIENRKYIVKNDWYCRYIKVKTPSGETLEFPCYRWVVNDQEVVLRDGRARLPQDDKTSLLEEHRSKELETRKKTYRWREWQPGFPMSIDAHTYKELPLDIQFDSKKEMDFTINYVKAIENLGLNKFMEMFQSSWDDLDDFKEIFVNISSTPAEYVMQHWKEDFVFAYQFLNGCNPVMIRKCTKLPAKFPVTHEMVEFCLERHLTLEEEIEAGNIYIVDYEIMENITPNGTDPSTTQYLAAPICLLYKNTKNKIQPIAIQLGQNPGENSPIFLPNDEDCDWTLAKMWVRLSDFSVHQTITHLLRTHLISEVFGIALFRQLPAVHPVYKLIIPHIRFTIAINTKAREQLIGENGLFDKANGVGGGGHVELVQKGMKTCTYQSLVFPEAIKASGMEDLPDYFYRDDGNKVWEAIKSFVEDIVHIYYKSDNVVQEDEEIQAFVKDVCMFGFQNRDNSGFPKSLKNRKQLIEYLTIIIFTASAQHAAVNFGQFHWNSCIPNCPSTMRKPPPTKKGVATTAYIIESLPDRGRTCWHLGASWALSRFQKHELFLGMYTDEHFVETPVKEAMEKYRKKLAEVVCLIQARNNGNHLPYCLLSPDRIPNSVAV